jgi:hypothetical protein
MKRFTWTLALLALGCETNETAMTITHVILPEADMTTMTCKFDATSAKAGPLNLDTGASLSMSIPFAVANNLSVRASDFSPTDEEAPVLTAAEITPVRFDARFECDTSAYSGARASGLILPRIDPQTSFCTDRRADSAASSANSDVLTAYGAAIKPAEIGTAIVRFPHELGYAIDELFDIARLADDCCRNTPNCGGSGGYMACVGAAGHLLGHRREREPRGARVADRGQPDAAAVRGLRGLRRRLHPERRHALPRQVAARCSRCTCAARCRA